MSLGWQPVRRPVYVVPRVGPWIPAPETRTAFYGYRPEIVGPPLAYPYLGGRTWVGADAAASADPVGDAKASVKAQVISEGGNAIDAQAASDRLQQTWDQLVGPGGVAADGTSALAAATRYAQLSFSPSGLLDQASHLAASVAAGAPTTELLTTLGGMAIAAAVVGGAVSLGVGAAIVGGISLVKDAIDAITSTPPPVANVCGVDYSWMPNFTVGCVGTNAKRIESAIFADGTANPGWRHFPSRAKLDDANVWYTPRPLTSLPWAGSKTADGSPATWVGPGSVSHGSWTGTIPLAFVAFPELAHIECEMVPYIAGANALTDFFLAFIAAWKANKEYALNGLKSAADWQVLVHVVNVWNHTHQGWRSDGPPDGPYVDLEPRARTLLQPVDAPCDPNHPQRVPYATICIADIPASDPVLSPAHGNLRVNQGPLRAIPQAPAHLVQLNKKCANGRVVSIFEACPSAAAASSGGAGGGGMVAAAGVGVAALLFLLLKK